MNTFLRIRLYVCLCLLTFLFLPMGRGDVFSNVPEAAGYTLIYDLSPPTDGNFRDTTAVPYSVNNSAMLLRAGFDRVAYYLELVTGTTTNWVYVSMDDFTRGSLKAIGIPHNVRNPVAHARIVNNMNVYASAGAGVTTGTGIQTGNIEMWPSNYGANNDRGIPGASNTTLDWGDGNFHAGAGHSCFQIHNHGASEVIFAYNHWGAGGADSLGIGSRGSSHPDWTFAYNAASYTARRLQILVRELSGDIDRLASTVKSRVAEAATFELVQDLNIPTGPLQFNVQHIPFTIDRPGALASSIGRVAYYLELDSDWVYVSMDPFSSDPIQLGVPSSGPNGNGGVTFQQLVDNINVHASPGANVTTGTAIQTGNIEFWYSNYQNLNTLPVPNARADRYDFGDNPSAGNYGTMQIHNHDLDGGGAGTAGETIMSFSRWGNHGGGNACLGIGSNPTWTNNDPDWTFTQNAASYTTRRLQVLVQPRVYMNVPEAADYVVVYGLEIPNQGNFRNSNPVPYAIDNSDRILDDGFDRVAYYFELDNGSGLEWVYVSMDDTFSQHTLSSLGLPHNVDNPVAYQQIVSNMNVYASAGAGVTTGTGLQTGNIEMWPGSFDGANAIGIPNASEVTGNRDFGDRNTTGTGAGYGSFQVCNHDLDGGGPGTAGEVIFAYNRFGTTGTSDLGFGNDPNTGRGNYNIDWTWIGNAGTYTVKNLFILARPRTNVNVLAATLHERVPEADDYELVYDLDIPTRADWSSTRIPYLIDRSDILPPSFGRIAYYLELDGTWAYASMDAFTQDLGQIGVPSSGPGGNGGITIQQFLTNMNVRASTGSGIVQGDGIQTGNIEFWPINYTGANGLPVPNADGGTYDFGDTPTPGNHGSMQIHNHDLDGVGPGTAGQTIFSYSHWNALNEDNVLGIGNQPTGHPDWTFSNNAGSYTTKHMQILVLPRVFDDVPRARDYSLLYLLEIPTTAPTDFHTYGVPYLIDRSEELAGQIIHRVAYYLELKKPGGSREWVYASFDPFTQDVTKLGVPNSDVGRVWQRNVNNLIVYAGGGAEARVTTDLGITTGNIEFWPNDYGTANEAGVTGASGSTYDFGDDVSEAAPSGYGSMQVHNHGAAEVIFAYNAWGSPTRTGCLGIGSQTVDHPDWTHNDNAGQFEIANLYVLVQTPPPASQFMFR